MGLLDRERRCRHKQHWLHPDLHGTVHQAQRTRSSLQLCMQAGCRSRQRRACGSARASVKAGSPAAEATSSICGRPQKGSTKVSDRRAEQ